MLTLIALTVKVSVAGLVSQRNPEAMGQDSSSAIGTLPRVGLPSILSLNRDVGGGVASRNQCGSRRPEKVRCP